MVRILINSLYTYKFSDVMILNQVADPVEDFSYSDLTFVFKTTNYSML